MSPSTAVALSPDVSLDELTALKNVLGVKDHTDAELTLFALTAKRLGLDPFARQIYSIKRKDNQSGTYRQSIQVSIDGFRSIADRTGMYAGQDEPTYGPRIKGRTAEEKDHPEFATVRVLKLIGGQIVGTAATAYWDEFAVTGPGGRMWRSMPHVMLAKCAEAQALRKAFPTQLSGVYTDDEMGQADRPTAQRTDVDRSTGEVRPQSVPPAPQPPQNVSDADIASLHAQFSQPPAEAAWTPEELAGIAPTGGMTTGEFLRACENANIPREAIASVAKDMFGSGAVKQLSDADRQAIFDELMRVPA